MKKLLISTAILAAAGMSASANAALATGDTLNFDAGFTGGPYNFVQGGSYFAMDNNGDGNFFPGERTAIAQNNGLVVGTSQLASGTHTGTPDGSESAGVDAAWAFFGNTGLHQTTSATTVLGTTANSADLDFSGWSVTWNGIGDIPMGAGTSGGVATVMCAVDCGDGDSYTLDYFATVPIGDPSGFGGVGYTLHLEGTISTSAVPVPAAVWLFGSGLLGLVGVARRRKAA